MFSNLENSYWRAESAGQAISMANPFPLRILIQPKVGIHCVPVSTVLGRKTVSNVLEYLKKMFKGRVEGTLPFFFLTKTSRQRGDP